MPIHDWTRVDAGTFHHFHNVWIQEICAALNEGVLPRDFYAISEQVMGEVVPDVLTLRAPSLRGTEDLSGVATLELHPPQVRFTASLEGELYLARQKNIAIRSSKNDDLVAIIEVISPGNKTSQANLDELLVKLASVLKQGIHVLVIDLLPPTPRDPQGMHGALWLYLGDGQYEAPPDQPLTLASYDAGLPLRAFVEPLKVGDSLVRMPLFVRRDRYVEVPLAETYEVSYRRVPRHRRAPLER